MSANDTNGSATERVYWRSPSQLAATSEFRDILDREFPEGVADGPGIGDDVSRRNFLTAVAASVAATGLASCRKPKQKILAFNQRPEFMIPGVPLHYATALSVGGFGVGILARSNDGRPTHIEGNPDHPASLGAANAHLQAEILNLYDPARSTEPRELAHAHAHAGAEAGHAEADHGHAGAESHMAQFEAYLRVQRSRLQEVQGQGLHVLLPLSSSPTLARLLDVLRAAMPQVQVHRYSPIDDDNARSGAELAFGRAVETHCAFDRCTTIASFDHDFLGLDGDALRATRDYAKSRKITDAKGSVARLYVAESAFSITGSNADHRLRIAASQIPVALCALAAELGVAGGGALGRALEAYKGKAFTYRKKANWVPAVASDLRANGGRSAVLVGPRQPAIAHAIAHAINVHLGNVGKTVRHTSSGASIGASDLSALAGALNAGRVDTIITLGCNPVYDAPADLGFATAYAKAKQKVHVGLHVDETALASDWHCNGTHELEAWGDIVARDGTVTIQQPLIAPLYDGISTIEILACLAGVADQPSGHDLVRATWSDRGDGDDFETWWNRALHDGLIAGTAAADATVSIDFGRIAQAFTGWKPTAAPTATNLELEIRPDLTVLDGRFSNNAWLQEVPDPITKIVWDNAVLMSRATAQAIGFEIDDEGHIKGANVVSLTRGGQTVEGPVWMVPGHADHVVTVTLGYGRRMDAHCEVAAGAGFDAFPLRTRDAKHGGAGLKVARTSRSVKLVTAQDHGSLEGRPLFREADLAQYKANPKFAYEASPLAQVANLKTELSAKHGGHQEHVVERDLLKSLWPERDYTEGYQWGMVIDLNSCTGCNACVVACTSENNISMVGKDQVALGREMFWNRMDRYFTSDARDNPMEDDDPGVAHQMVPCMQCENAPCESVCPVAATTHSPEGLNDMAYNRCIGTRYCNNNCPYKVRRFNWFNFNLEVPKSRQMAFNPNVTVRARGVMEKCTYCVQRINQAKINSKREHRLVRDGEIRPACAQGCPAEAITFGNIVDKNSEVAKLKASNLNYAMLSEMNNKPRTTYLAKIRNYNPELMGA